MLNATVSYSFGARHGHVTVYQASHLSLPTSVVVQVIQNLTTVGTFGLHVDPENADMRAMFSAIVDDVVIVKDENGSVYWPNLG